jgi:hypothetical protein
MESSAPGRRGGEVTGLPDEFAESERLVRLRRLYAVLVETSEAIVRATTRDELLRAACRIAVDQGGFRMAWAGTVDVAAGVVRKVTSCGDVEGDSDLEWRGPAGMAGRTGRPAWINDISLPLGWRLSAACR